MIEQITLGDYPKLDFVMKLISQIRRTLDMAIRYPQLFRT